MDTALRAVVDAIHASPTRAVLVLSGGASQAIGWLLSVPGASNSVLEVSVPYSRLSMMKIIGQVRWIWSNILLCSQSRAENLCKFSARLCVVLQSSDIPSPPLSDKKLHFFYECEQSLMKSHIMHTFATSFFTPFSNPNKLQVTSPSLNSLHILFHNQSSFSSSTSSSPAPLSRLLHQLPQNYVSSHTAELMALSAYNRALRLSPPGLSPVNYVVPYCTFLYLIVPYCTLLYLFVPHCTILCLIVPHCHFLMVCQHSYRPFKCFTSCVLANLDLSHVCEALTCR